MHYSDDGSAAASWHRLNYRLQTRFVPRRDFHATGLNCGLNERFGRRENPRRPRIRPSRRFAVRCRALPRRLAIAPARQSSQSFRREQEPDLSRAETNELTVPTSPLLFPPTPLSPALGVI